MLPFILGTVVFAQVAVLGYFFIGLSFIIFIFILYCFAFVWARRISRNDDQRLSQFIMRVRMRGPQGASKRYWGAVSFSPLQVRK